MYRNFVIFDTSLNLLFISDILWLFKYSIIGNVEGGLEKLFYSFRFITIIFPLFVVQYIDTPWLWTDTICSPLLYSISLLLKFISVLLDESNLAL